MLDTYFPAFIACFYPEIEALVDWAAGDTMLDQELLALTTESMIGKRGVDKLVQIYDKTGQAVLLRTEVVQRENRLKGRKRGVSRGSLSPVPT